MTGKTTSWTFRGYVGNREGFATVAASGKFEALWKAHDLFDESDRKAGLPVSNLRAIRRMEMRPYGKPAL